MDRRTLLKLTVAGAAAVIPVPGRNEAAAQTPAAVAKFELDGATVADLQAAMQSGARSAVSIAQA
ncbi:MAG: hypothetical protein ABI593_17505, partial [Betaproteobacteria bacterium]